MMKKISALLTAFVISSTCLFSCGSSDNFSDEVTASLEELEEIIIGIDELADNGELYKGKELTVIGKATYYRSSSTHVIPDLLKERGVESILELENTVEDGCNHYVYCCFDMNHDEYNELYCQGDGTVIAVKGFLNDNETDYWAPTDVNAVTVYLSDCELITLEGITNEKITQLVNYYSSIKSTSLNSTTETINAKQLISDFKENEVAVENKYLNQNITITGTINSIETLDSLYDKYGRYCVRIGSLGEDLYCFFDSSDNLTELKKGDEVIISGIYSGKWGSSSPYMTHCEIK